MKKFYMLLLLASAILSASAQKKLLPAKNVFKPATQLSFPANFAAEECNKINYPVPASWGKPTVPTYDEDNIIDSGFTTGTNFFDDLEKAQYFDVFGTENKYISQARISFAVAHAVDSETVIPIKVYDGTTGTPKRLLGSANLTMRKIIGDVNKGLPTDVIFSPAIALPSSKKFFVSVDISKLTWFQEEDSDSLAIYSSVEAGASGAWEKYFVSGAPAGWASFPEDYGVDRGLYIHPFLSAGQTCNALPVHLLSFTATPKGSNVQLNWAVTQEYNMQGYAVERATGTALRFETIGNVAATNAATDHAYTFTDANALTAGTTVYYRLNQVNKDGKSVSSNIVTLSNPAGELSVKVVNPFKNAVQLQVNAPTAQRLQAAMYDIQGRRVATLPAQVLVAGQNTITIPAGNLPKGVYLLTVTTGNNTLKYKIVN